MKTIVTAPQTFLLPTDQGLKAIALEQLVRVEALSNYSRLYFSDGKSLVVARVLRKFEYELATGGFLRIHHKHLVNLQWLVGGGINQCFLLRNGETLTASRRKKKIVQDALTKWLTEKGVTEPALHRM